MDPLAIGLFDLSDRRLAWLGQRQQVLAQNVANADTPGYQPRDLQPFAQALAGADPPRMAMTSPLDLPPLAQGDWLAAHAVRPEAIAPDGNAVQVEDQLAKVADTQSAQQLVLGLYKKYLGMFHTALS